MNTERVAIQGKTEQNQVSLTGMLSAMIGGTLNMVVGILDAVGRTFNIFQRKKEVNISNIIDQTIKLDINNIMLRAEKETRQNINQYLKQEELGSIRPINKLFNEIISKLDDDHTSRKAIALYREAIVFYKAIEDSDIEKVKVMIQADEDVRALINTRTRMRYTIAQDGYIEIERVGDTILHFAAEKGSAEIVNILIAAGVDPCIKNKNGKTAKSVAVNDEIREICKGREKKLFTLKKRLLVHYYDLFIPEKDGRIVVYILFRDHVLPGITSMRTINKLIKAAFGESVFQKVEKVLLNGINVRDVELINQCIDIISQLTTEPTEDPVEELPSSSKMSGIILEHGCRER